MMARRCGGASVLRFRRLVRLGELEAENVWVRRPVGVTVSR